MTLFKVWDSARKTKVMLIASNLADLKRESIRKLKINNDCPENLKVVLESDGTEIDEDEILKHFIDTVGFRECIFMLLKENESWTPRSATASNPPAPQPSKEIHVPPVVVTQSSSVVDVEKTINNPEAASSPAMSDISLDGFEIPWKKMPSRLMNCLKAERIPESADRRQMVRIIIDGIREINKKPKRCIIERIAQKAVHSYPNSLMDKINGITLGNGYAFMFRQFEARLENLNRSQTQKSLKKTLAENSTSKTGPMTDSYGCVSWQPDALPSGEDEESQETKRMWLCENAQYAATDRDEGKMVDYMEKTYVSQRLCTNCTKNDISDVRLKWPLLFEYLFMMNHGATLLGKCLKVQWSTFHEKHSDNIMEFMRKNKNKPLLSSKLDEVDDAITIVGNHAPRQGCIVPLVLTYMRDDFSKMFKIFEEATSPRTIAAADLPTTPLIAIIGNNIYSAKYYLVIEAQSVSPMMENIDMVLQMLFCSYYIFNMKYPETLAATLEFMQKSIFNINPEKGSKRDGKRKKSATHPKLLKFSQELSHYC